MDGISGMTGIEREHLSCATCRGQQYHTLLEGGHSANDGSGKGGLTRTSRTAEYHRHMVVAVGHKHREHVDGVLLFCRRHQSEGLANAVFKLVDNHFGCKDTKN